MLWKYGEKISRFGKRWQKRYFVLQKDKLFYYKSLVHFPPLSIETHHQSESSFHQKEHNQRGEALSFVAIQRVRAIVSMPPFDSFSRKSSGSCFQVNIKLLASHPAGCSETHMKPHQLQIETVTGEVFQLIAENQQQQAEWVRDIVLCLSWYLEISCLIFFKTDQLMAWLELKMFFGPDKRSSVQLFRKLSAERDQRRQTRAGSIVGGKALTVPSLPLKVQILLTSSAAQGSRLTSSLKPQKSHSPPQQRREQVVERATEPISDESKEADVVLEVEEQQPEEGAVEINLLLHDGSIQPLVVDPNVEIYDLVYAVAHEIGRPSLSNAASSLPGLTYHELQDRSMRSKSLLSIKIRPEEVRPMHTLDGLNSILTCRRFSGIARPSEDTTTASRTKNCHVRFEEDGHR